MSRVRAAASVTATLVLAGGCGGDAQDASPPLGARLLERLPKPQYNLVATRYTPAHEGGFPREDISVRQLIQTQLEGLSEDFGVADHACLERHRNELRTLLSSG